MEFSDLYATYESYSRDYYCSSGSGLVAIPNGYPLEYIKRIFDGGNVVSVEGQIMCDKLEVRAP